MNRITSGVPAKPSELVDTRVIYCGDNLDYLRQPLKFRLLARVVQFKMAS